MRVIKIARAVLLCTTMLSFPSEAKAGPVMPFIGGFLNALGFGTFLGSASFIGAWTAGFSAASWLAGGSILSRLVLSVGLSAISGALNRPKTPPPAEVLSNYAQDVPHADFVFGEVRKGGPFCLSAFSRSGATVTYAGTSGSVVESAIARRHYGILLAAHPIDSVVQHYLDKWPVSTDASLSVTTEPVSGRCRIRLYRGQTGQAADPLWDAIFPELTSADNFKGLSYAALYADRPADSDFADVYPSGREWSYSPVIRGWDKIYDPRTATYGYSKNAALVIAHAATSLYGKSVDWAEVANEATVSDQFVTTRTGATQRRWTINTVIRGDMPWEDARTHFQMCCDAFFYERRDGKLGFKVGYYSAPTVTLSDSDFLSLSLRHKAHGPDKVDAYAMRYVEPSRDWSEEVTGPVVVGDGTERAEESCYGINSHNQAWRVIYRWAKTAQPEWSLSATIKAIGYECMEQRFLRLQHVETGIDIVVEVGKLGRNQGGHTFQLEAVSVAEGDFSPNAVALEPSPPTREIIAEDGTVPAPAFIDADVIEGTGGVALIEVTWPAQQPDLRQQVQIRAPASGISEWQIIDAGVGQTSLVFSGLIDGADYEIQVRNRTAAGRLSVLVPSVPLVRRAVANTTPPPILDAFSVAVTGGTTAAITFTAPNSPNYAATKIWRGTTAVFGAASPIHTEPGLMGLADSWNNTGLAPGTYYFWGTPTNASGVEGPELGASPITII